MEEIMAKNIGRAKFVKRARLERAWSQAQLADVSGVNSRTIQRVERDGSASFETLMAIASALEIDVKELNLTSNQLSTKETTPPQKKVHFLSRILTGKNLSDVVLGSDQFQVEHDDAQDPRAIGAMKGILELLKQDIVRLHDADPVARLDVESQMSQEISGLEKYGFFLFGIKRKIPQVVGRKKNEISMCTLYMSHAQSPKIIIDKNLKMVVPAVLTEIAK